MRTRAAIVTFLRVFESAPAQRLSEQDALASFKVKVERAAGRDLFAGAVLVAKNGRTIFSGAWGLADRERKLPNRLETRFRIGSMNLDPPAASRLADFVTARLPAR